MQLSIRAGLVISLFSLFATLASAAPLPVVVGSPPSSLQTINVPVNSQSAAQIALHVPPNTPHTTISITKDKPEQSVLFRRTSLKERMHNLHEKVKTAFHNFGQKVKAGFQKVGQKLKVGFQKVGHFLKTTGAKIVKFGMKIVSTVQKIAGKVIGAIVPGVGKVIGKGLEAASKVTNKISDSIHVSLGKKLDKGMNVLNKVQKVSGFVPRDAVEYDERDALGWDFDPREDYMGFVERDMAEFGYEAGLFM